jgi:Leucine-rich repeat (LRR) protein
LIPEQIYNKLPRLENFKICNNLVNNISASIKKWQDHLTELDIGFNRITHLKNLHYLIELRILRIESNEFRLLPFSLYKLENLYEFGLDWYKYISPP